MIKEDSDATKMTVRLFVISCWCLMTRWKRCLLRFCPFLEGVQFFKINVSVLQQRLFTDISIAPMREIPLDSFGRIQTFRDVILDLTTVTGAFKFYQRWNEDIKVCFISKSFRVLKIITSCLDQKWLRGKKNIDQIAHYLFVWETSCLEMMVIRAELICSSF